MTLRGDLEASPYLTIIAMHVVLVLLAAYVVLSTREPAKEALDEV